MVEQVFDTGCEVGDLKSVGGLLKKSRAQPSRCLEILTC